MPTGEANKDSLSESYDLVLNGFEIGGGSIRINNADMQRKVFEILGISNEGARRKIWTHVGSFRVWCTSTWWFCIWIR